MMLSTRASKGDWALATRMVKGPARSMSLPSLGSAAVSAAMAAAESYFGARGVALARGMKMKVSQRGVAQERFVMSGGLRGGD